MPLLLGVDAGNSKTLAMLATEHGDIVGVGRSGCGNHQAFGVEPALNQIRDAVEQAVAETNHLSEQVAYAFYALCGADLDSDFAVLRPEVAKLAYSDAHAFDNDVAAALRAGTNNPNAVVVVLGSGTNAAGRNDSGEQIRLPGLGWMSGDWGGAGDLVREAVRLVARAWDGRGNRTRMETTFTDAVGATDVSGLIGALHSQRISQNQQYDLAPLIFEAADAGDPVARDLVVAAGREVATTALALLGRLRLLDKRADVVLSGGLFRQENQILLDTISDQMFDAAPDARLIIPDVEPAVGALLCAFDAAGIPTDEAVLRRLTETSQSRLGMLGPRSTAG